MTINHRQAFLILIAVQVLYFSPILFNGEVISPHDNDLEVAAQVSIASDQISNRNFSDHSSQFIPTINQHLNSQHQAWLATWTPNVQLGRPDYQRWPSKANLITHVLSLFTSNPYVLYTSLTVLIVCLTGTFCFLFLKSLNLHPLACFAVSAGFSLGPYFSYWLTFVQFISVRCWTLGLLWLIVEFIRKRSFTTGTGIAFFTYCLLMMGRLQATLRSAYLVIGFTAIYLWLSNHSHKMKLHTASLLVGAALFGALTTLPTYSDMMVNAARSARVSGVSDEFFLANLPKIQTFNELGLFFLQLFDPFWFGNPILPDRSYTFNGLSLTPIYFIFFALSFADGQWRRLWPWQLFVAICLLATLWSPAYLFMVHYMGFNISQSKPLGAAVIPAVVLAGYALNHILRNGLEQVLWLAALILFPFLAVGFLSFIQDRELHWGFVAACLLLVLGTSLFVKTRNPVLLILLVVSSVVIYGASMRLTRPLTQIQVSSPLVERIKLETRDGSRYAWVGPNKGVLPANQEILLGIKSIHSYDSISSQNYQRMVLELSEEGTNTYGRYFNYIATDAKINQPAFSYAGISLILSYDELDNPLLEKVGELETIKLYKTLNSPILEAQLTHFDYEDDMPITLAGHLDEQTGLKVERLTSLDDFLLFQVTPAERETLLFVSQQYHPQWRASSQGRALSTVIVNDFYLGVIVPPHTTQVELEFRPLVRTSWIPQIIYVVFGSGLLFKFTKESFPRADNAQKGAPLRK